jgi:3-deoxy-D-manno-octulosonic-acid transferase
VYALYSFLLALAVFFYAPVFVVRRLLPGGYASGFRQRFGRGLPTGQDARSCWIHAVSVGEAATAVPLVEAIRRRWPRLKVILSTVTPTGARVVRDRLGDRVTHCYFPLDLPGPVRRAVGAIAPVFFIALETELWPNFFRELSRLGIPSMIVNGRISDRSFRRYRWIRFLLRRLLRQITVFAMQSPEDARRIIALGAPAERVVVTGNLKTEPLPPEAGAGKVWERLLGLTGKELVWVAGSTHRGEEVILLDAFRDLRARYPSLTLVIAPRDPGRVPEVERLLRDRELVGVRRTTLPGNSARRDAILLDTVGELAQLYGLADVVFVGGSLIPWGGHNMLEPAFHRKPVVFGPHNMNFRESAELLLRSGGAIQVSDGQELRTAIERLLADPGLRARMGEAGFQAVGSRRGVVADSLELIQRYLMDRPRGEGR